MNKIRLIIGMLLVVTGLASCANPAGNDSGSGSQAEYAKDIRYAIEFKINGVQCIYTYGKAGYYVMYDKAVDDSLKEYLDDPIEDNKYFYFNEFEGCIQGYLCKSAIKKEVLSDKEKLHNLFGENIVISDINILIYFEDQFISKTTGTINKLGKFELYEKKLPEFYLNNTGSNSFTARNKKITYLTVPVGNPAKEHAITETFEFKKDSELKKSGVSVYCAYITPENIWKNKTTYKNLKEYKYKIEIVYQDSDKNRKTKTFTFNLKTFMDDIFNFNEKIFTDDSKVTVR